MQVLDGTPAPLLVVPATEASPIRNALIAFDGSASATRALHAFADLWPVYRPEVKLLACEKDKKSGGHLLDQAQKFLQVHGVTTLTTELSRKSAIKAVADDYLDWADLIVAGVRSRHPIQKLFVGSFARYLVKESHRTLLLCQ